MLRQVIQAQLAEHLCVHTCAEVLRETSLNRHHQRCMYTYLILSWKSLIPRQWHKEHGTGKHG